MAILVAAKGTYEVWLGQRQDEWIPAPTLHILKVDKEALTGLSHVYGACVFNTTSPCQGCVPGAASGSGKGEWNSHSEDRGRGEEPPSAWVQLTGQSAATSS